MASSPRIYLDNAATSWPKPDSVNSAVMDYLQNNGAPAGRGSYKEAQWVEREIDICRKKISKLVGASNSDSIAFTQNCTDSLNLAIHGLLKQGDHVVTSATEHNSVLRPLNFLQDKLDITVTKVGLGEDGLLNGSDIENAIEDKTALIILNHESNVTGTIQPLEAIAKIANKHNIPLLLDAAQSIGSLEIDVEKTGISILAAPAHKGLYGILGGGFLYVDPKISEQIVPTRQGGTGTQSHQEIQPEHMPTRLESGNLNVPMIVSLSAGIDFVNEKGIQAIGKKIQNHAATLANEISQIDSISVYRTVPEKQGGIVCFNHAQIDPREFAMMLDSGYRIQCRAGFHCAPGMHAQLHENQNGAVRLSPGFFTTSAEISQTISAIQEIASVAI